MEYDHAINQFIASAQEVCSVRYAFAESKISELLRTVATHDELYEIFRAACSGYNAAAEFNRSITKVGGRSKLNPPQSQVKFIAYVFCLLLDVDTGKIALKDFLDEYFYHTNADEQYALFCASLIVPFRDITEYVFHNGTDGYDEDADTAATQSVKDALQELAQAVNASNLKPDKKQEIFILTRAIETALTPTRMDLVKPMFIGLKNTVAAHSMTSKLSRPMDKLVQELAHTDLL